jgi:ACR3 family arsenite efflux pump ArsB
MWRLLGQLNKNLLLAIPAMMVAGFVFGLATEPAFLKSLILPFTFLMVYPMMVTLKIREIFSTGDMRAQGLALLINFAIIPFIALGLGIVLLGDHPYLLLGLLLAALVPTSGMTISWTGFAKGNLAAAVKMTVFGLILGSLVTPLYLNLLLGARVPLDLGLVFRQIALVVFLPMAAGYVTQQFLLRRYGRDGFAQLSPRFPPLSTLGVLGIVFIAMALKAQGLAADPQQLLRLIFPLILLYASNYFISTIVGRLLLPRGDAIALVYGTVMRNLSIALAIAMTAFGAAGSDAALIIALAFIIQVQSAAWYVRFTDRIFGSAATPCPHKVIHDSTST